MNTTTYWIILRRLGDNAELQPEFKDKEQRLVYAQQYRRLNGQSDEIYMLTIDNGIPTVKTFTE